MQVLILQSAGEHKENAHLRECLCLQRAFSALGIVSYVTGPGFTENVDRSIEIWSSEVDLVLILENYWRSYWLSAIKKLTVDRGIKCAFWSIDSHVPAAKDRHLQLVNDQHIPFVFCSTETTQSFFQGIGVKTTWLPNAYDDQYIRPIGTKSSDVGFCGRLIAGRSEWLKSVSQLSRIPISIDEWVLGEDMVRAISSYRIGLNRAYNYDINYRCFETCGCRTALLTNKVPGIEKVLIPGEHCITYTDNEDCSVKIRKLLDSNDTTELIAYRGYEHVKQCHTYRNRAKKILEIMS